jgi:hypothetical protein
MFGPFFLITYPSSPEEGWHFTRYEWNDGVVNEGVVSGGVVLTRSSPP